LTKTLCNEKPKQSTAVYYRNGNALNSNEDRRKRWIKYFTRILNIEGPADLVNQEGDEQQDEDDIDTGRKLR